MAMVEHGTPPEVNSYITLEVRTEHDLQEEDIADLQNFANSEAQKARGTPPTQEDWNEKYSAAIVHLMAHSELNRAVTNNSPADVVLLRDMHKELIGYALAILDRKPKMNSNE